MQNVETVIYLKYFWKEINTFILQRWLKHAWQLPQKYSMAKTVFYIDDKNYY